MMRWSICLCAVLFAASCASDGGPGTESPGGGVGGIGGMGTGGTGGMDGNAGNAGGVGGVSGTAGGAGVGVTGGAGGVGGDIGAGMGGVGGMGGTMAGDDDGGTDDGGTDEGYCTVACTGIRPDDDVVEACGMIAESEECTMFETGGFPESCRWVTPDSEPCLVP